MLQPRVLSAHVCLFLQENTLTVAVREEDVGMQKEDPLPMLPYQRCCIGLRLAGMSHLLGMLPSWRQG